MSCDLNTLWGGEGKGSSKEEAGGQGEEAVLKSRGQRKRKAYL